LDLICEAIVEKFNNLIIGLGIWLCHTQARAWARRGFALNAGINSRKLGKNNN